LFGVLEEEEVVRQRSAAARSILRLTVMSLAVAGMMVSASPVKAQVLYGSIVGNVRDAQGAVVPGATVTITNKQTGLTRDSVTDDQGSYTLTNVLPGPYDVKVSLTGFRESVRANVPVTIGQISRVDLTLEVGALTEVVNVESAAELLQTDKADVHTELKSAEITAMPLNQFRN
jgi:Carboxypeptidase regulatory-like domain